MIKKVRFFIRKGDPGNPKGSEVVYIHNDAVARMFSGSKTSPKVSDIRFDDPSQEWVAYLRDGREIFRHKERDSVVSGEAKVIEGMFARGEYIPGGYMGVPRHQLPLPARTLLEESYSYLGISIFGGGVKDLYTSNNSPICLAINRSPEGRFSIFTSDFHATNLSDVLSGAEFNEMIDVYAGDMDAWPAEYESAVHESRRRAVIESRIKSEEQSKLSHHKDALK